MVNFFIFNYRSGMYEFKLKMSKQKVNLHCNIMTVLISPLIFVPYDFVTPEFER